MTIEIFRMTEGDIGPVAQLERSCFSSPWSENSLRESLGNPNYRMFVAKDEGRVVGYISTYIVADELNIANLAVDRSLRRQGIGWALLKTAVQTARSNRMTTMYLEVRASNEAAIALYRKAGFESGGRRKNFYDNPKEDGLIMRMDFED